MKPVKTIRFGSISASVFENEIDKEGGVTSLLTVNLQRRYRDSDGQWKSNTSFTLAELPAAIEVLRRAMEYIAVQKDGDMLPS